jgi:hypothetical protein
VIDTGKDLNAYAQAGGDSCCGSPASSTLPIAESACCGTVHDGLASVLSRYNVNDYAASVQVYALKPGP